MLIRSTLVRMSSGKYVSMSKRCIWLGHGSPENFSKSLASAISRERCRESPATERRQLIVLKSADRVEVAPCRIPRYVTEKVLAPSPVRQKPPRGISHASPKPAEARIECGDARRWQIAIVAGEQLVAAIADRTTVTCCRAICDTYHVGIAEESRERLVEMRDQICRRYSSASGLTTNS